MKLTAEQAELAAKLKPRILTFANLVLTKEEHKLTDADCYVKAGYKAKTLESQKTGASRLLADPDVKAYIEAMNAEAAAAAGLTLEFLDEKLFNLISSDPDNVNALKLGYQRRGGLIDRKEIGGVNGEPIQLGVSIDWAE